MGASATRQSVTISAATADTSGYTRLNCTPGSDGPSSDRDIGHQVARVTATMSNAAAMGVVRIVRRGALSGAAVTSQILLNLSATAHRTSQDGASGNYVASINSVDTGLFVDLYGIGPLDAGDVESWYVGAPTISAGTITLHFDFTRAI